MSNKFCPNCGFKLDDSFKFCPSCGFKFNNDNSATNTKSKTTDTSISELDKLFSDKIKSNENEKKQLEDNLKKAKYYLHKELYDEAITCYKQLIMQDRYNYDYYLGLLTAYTKNFEFFENKNIDKIYQIILKLFPDKKDDENIIKYNQNKETYLNNLNKQKEQEIANQENKKKAFENMILARHGIIMQENKVLFGHSKAEFFKFVQSEYKSFLFEDADGEVYFKDSDRLYKTKPIEWDILEKKDGYYLLISHDFIFTSSYESYKNSIYRWINYFFLDEEYKTLYDGIDLYDNFSSIKLDNNRRPSKFTIPTKKDYTDNSKIAFSGSINMCLKETRGEKIDYNHTFFRDSEVVVYNRFGMREIYGTYWQSYSVAELSLTSNYPLKIIICIDTNKFLADSDLYLK